VVAKKKKKKTTRRIPAGWHEVEGMGDAMNMAAGTVMTATTMQVGVGVIGTVAQSFKK
jgi:hypothetical protein